MAFIINDDCINCGACAIECPVEAILIPVKIFNNKISISKTLSAVHYFIDLLNCNECFNEDEHKCVEVCPMDAIKKINS